MSSRIHDEIRELAQANDAVILAHNYQHPEVQEVADFVGDSFELAKVGREVPPIDDCLLRRPFHG